MTPVVISGFIKCFSPPRSRFPWFLVSLTLTIWIVAHFVSGAPDTGRMIGGILASIIPGFIFTYWVGVLLGKIA
jgi:hypothetical protein